MRFEVVLVHCGRDEVESKFSGMCSYSHVKELIKKRLYDKFSATSVGRIARTSQLKFRDFHLLHVTVLLAVFTFSWFSHASAC